MPILITGGTGFIGAELARRLVARGEDIILFDIFPRTELVADIKDRVKIVRGDLQVWPEVLNAIRENKVEGIFHLGSMLSGPSEDNPWLAFQTITMGTMHVLEGARLFGVKRLVFASTSATYGLGTGEVITDETLQRPITIYGASKLYGELLGRFYRRKFGLDFRALRYFSVIGPGGRPTPVVAHNTFIIQNAALGIPYECVVSEDVAVPITYVKDAARATEMLYYAPEKQIKTICYNVAGMSSARSAKELELAVKKLIPEARISYRPDPEFMKFYRQFFGQMKVFDDGRAREEWGWQPVYTDLDKLVEDFVREVRTRPHLYGLA